MKKIKALFEKVVAGLLIMIFCLSFSGNVQAEGDSISDAKNGIIEIYAGFTDNSGNFHKLKNASGVVIGIQENSAYVLTNNKILTSSEKSKKEYCEEKGIQYEGYGFNDVIHAVVEGDVTSEVQILTSSEKQNYAVLLINNSNIEKTPLELGSSDELLTGKTVYSLGFAEDAGENDDEQNRLTKYSAFDVEVTAGIVEDPKANKDGVAYIQHSAKVHKGNNGGALLDENGYVVGINNVALNEDGEAVYFSLPINDIKVVLESFQVNYESWERTELLKEIQKKMKHAEEVLASKSYKNDSKEALSQELESAADVINENSYNLEAMEEVLEKLTEAEGKLELKVKTAKKVIYVLGAIVVLLAAWAIKLFVEECTRNKGKKPAIKKENPKKEPPKQEPPKQEPPKQEPAKDDPTVYFPYNYEMKKSTAYVQATATGKIAQITGDKFYLGRKKEMVDFVIDTNPGIGRCHAVIEVEDGHYYISDCNSANGTFLNGDKVKVPMRLSDGDIILLANEEILFKIK